MQVLSLIIHISQASALRGRGGGGGGEGGGWIAVDGPAKSDKIPAGDEVAGIVMISFGGCVAFLLTAELMRSWCLERSAAVF